MNLLNYIKGSRKGKEAHRLEMEAMSDPFLAEAIDGYDLVAGDHLSRVANMQKQISAHGKRNNSFSWILSACSVAAAVAFTVYFTVWNKPYNDSEYTDSEVLYVYLPENYESKYNLTPNVKIENADMLTPAEKLDIYIPDDYVEKKKTENHQHEMNVITQTVIISNIDEIFAPDEPIYIYLPDTYVSKEK